MNTNFLKALENKNDISISDFVYFSGKYKASLTLTKFNEDTGNFRTTNLVVKRSETYQQAIEKALNN